MPTNVQNILKTMKTKYHLNLLAGENGSFQAVNWVYILEDMKNCDFIRSGELIITTGLQIHTPESICKLLKLLSEKNCSGLILNTGRYILPDNLTPEIIKTSNDLAIPLLTMPWNIHISDFMQEICLQLSRQFQQTQTITIAFENAILNPQYKDLYLPALAHEGYIPDNNYQVLVIDHEDSMDDIKASFLAEDLTGIPIHVNQQICVILYDRQIKLMDLIIMTLLDTRGILGIYVGEPVSHVSELKASYQQALFAKNISASSKITAYHNKINDDQKETHPRIPAYDPHARESIAYPANINTRRNVMYPQNVVFFHDLGIYQLFFQQEDMSMLLHMKNMILHDLEAYDHTHQTDYTETMYVYLLTNNSIQETANQMHTHRNTINYRIRKLRELTGQNLDDPLVRFNYFLAYYIRDYLSLS
ncbi:MAG: PucR family transcriptional regulator ligand-binding domain-containing protein [Lachnospiraceae bacterium]|nr:PucR family transcriptional regulator ligand-binding domain-containing protein [Lachnospiraceae bacterium]MDD3614664.1 PucR family transcriptional regulator ligand-binding domain-containing protein [Lachnospiraceae bacterium]